jgi:tubulin---tyrosine ligase
MLTIANAFNQPLPNAFELYGIDFLVSHNPIPSSTSSESRLQVQLLEINSEPAIELTGPRLTWILEDLFVAMGKICVQPFLDRPSGADSKQLSEAEVEDGGLWLGEDKLAVRKVFDFEVRGSGGW